MGGTHRPSAPREGGACAGQPPFPRRGAVGQRRLHPPVPGIPWGGGGGRQGKGPPQVGGGGGGVWRLRGREVSSPRPRRLSGVRTPETSSPWQTSDPPAGAGGFGIEHGRASTAARPGGSGAGWGVLCVCVWGGSRCRALVRRRAGGGDWGAKVQQGGKHAEAKMRYKWLSGLSGKTRL